MNRLFARGALLIGLALSLAFAGPAARAQSRPTLSVTPADSDLIWNDTRTVRLYVTAGENVNAFDVTVHYDPAILELTSWSTGNYLANLWKVYQVNTPGVFRLACTQLASPGKSGDGDLLDLVFRGAANGISAIALADAQFSDPQGRSIDPTRVDGRLWVHADPALLASVPLTGTLWLQGQPGQGGAPLALGYGLQHWLGPYRAVSSAAPAENLRFEQVYADDYRITTHMPRYLNITAAANKIKTIGPGSASLAPLELLGGNAVWQDATDSGWVANTVIDQADVDQVLAQYLQTGADLEGDVNFSGRVDLFDLAMVGGNFGLTSQLAYQNWTP